MFARVVLDPGGQIEVVLLAADDQQRKVTPDNAVDFAELISTAHIVTRMPFEQSNREAWMTSPIRTDSGLWTDQLRYSS